MKPSPRLESIDLSGVRKMFDLVGTVAAQVPTYILQFDRSGQVLELLRGL